MLKNKSADVNMIKDKILPLVYTLIVAIIGIAGAVFLPVSRFTMKIFGKEVVKEFYLKDINEKAIIVFIILTVISVIFSCTKYKIVSMIGGIFSFVYMIYVVVDFADTYTRLGAFKDNVEGLSGVYLLIIGNVLLMTVTIVNYVKFIKSRKLKSM